MLVVQRDLKKLEKWSIRNTMKFSIEKCQVHLGKKNPMFLYSFGADQLKSSLAEKCPGVLVGAKFTASRVPLQQRRPTAYWDSLGRVGSTLMGVIIPLCSAAMKLHPVLSFPEQDRHSCIEASSWKIVKIKKGLEHNISDTGLREQELFVLEKRKFREILSICLLKRVKKPWSQIPSPVLIGIQ